MMACERHVHVGHVPLGARRAERVQRVVQRQPKPEFQWQQLPVRFDPKKTVHLIYSPSQTMPSNLSTTNNYGWGIVLRLEGMLRTQGAIAGHVPSAAATGEHRVAVRLQMTHGQKAMLLAIRFPFVRPYAR
jgi:hypothetical protein